MARRIARRTPDPDILAERLGRPSRARPAGPLVWVHLSSDSEAASILELVQRMRDERDEIHFLLTTNRVVTEGWVPGRIADGVVHQRAPADHPSFSKDFLDHWKPDICVFTEEDLRASLIVEASNRDIPMFLIDARLSNQRSYRWRWFPGAAAALFDRFDRILVGDADSAKRLRKIGAPSERMEETGMLEEGTAALACDEDERDRIAHLMQSRPVWQAAFVDDAEVEMVTMAHRHAARSSHRLLLILAPSDRDGARALSVRLEAQGWSVALRSRDEDPDERTQILIADLPGEMGLWYRLAPVTFLGTSLAAGGGRNPFEPAALGSAILHGPNVSAYQASYARLADAGATRLVPTADALAIAVEELLAPDRAADMAHAAWLVCSSGAEVTDRVKELLFNSLDDRETA